jgi:hypothetical protein
MGLEGMMPTKKTIFCALTVVVTLGALISCGGPPGVTRFELSDGSHIFVEEIGHFYVAPEDRWLLQLKYVSEIPISNEYALRKQAELVWAKFIHDVEKTDYELAALAVSNKRKPVLGVFTRTGFRFVLERVPNGDWEWVDDRQEETSRVSD